MGMVVINISTAVWKKTWHCVTFERQAASPFHLSCSRSSTSPQRMRSRETFARPLLIQLLCKFHRSVTRTTANTDSALVGFLLSLTPLSWTLMGWRGAGGSGSASIGWYFFMGGLLMVLGGVGEVCLPFFFHLSKTTKLTPTSGSWATPSPS
jgi:hypothetical protein